MVLALARTSAARAQSLPEPAAEEVVQQPPFGFESVAAIAASLSARDWKNPSAPLTDLAAVGEKLNAAATPWRATVYGGARHTFTVPGSKDHVEAADQDSWAQFAVFLGEVFR